MGMVRKLAFLAEQHSSAYYPIESASCYLVEHLKVPASILPAIQESFPMAITWQPADHCHPSSQLVAAWRVPTLDKEGL